MRKPSRSTENPQKEVNQEEMGGLFEEKMPRKRQPWQGTYIRVGFVGSGEIGSRAGPFMREEESRDRGIKE